jgi:hypothetical protein
MIITPVDEQNNLFSVTNILPDNIIDQIKQEDLLNYSWELQEEQHDWKRRKLLPASDSPILKIDNIYMSVMDQIAQALNIQFSVNHCNSNFWLDYMGFGCPIHLDGFGERPKIAMQIYLTETPHELGTVFYHDTHGKKLRYRCPYKINTGYIMLNNDNQWHGMTETIPEGTFRLSSYTYFSRFEHK